MFNIALGIFLFLSPILWLPLSVPAIATLQFYQFGFFTNSIEIVQLQLFMIGVVLLMIVALLSVPKRMIVDNYLKWILLICLWSVYWHPVTIKLFPQVFLGFLLYYIVSVWVDVKKLKKLFWIVVAVSLLNTIFAILQFFNIHFIMFKEGEIIGLMGYKTHLGVYQALAMPICFTLNPWLTIIPAIGLLLSNSGTAIVAAVIGMTYFLWKKGLRINSLPIWQSFFTVVVIYLCWHYEKIWIRTESWVSALKQGMSHIFKGNGIGTFNYVHMTYINGNQPWPINYKDPYSLYLEVFYSVGLLGVILFILFIGQQLKPNGNNPIKVAVYSSCFILALIGFGYSFLDYPRLAGTAIVLFGMLKAVKKEHAE